MQQISLSFFTPLTSNLTHASLLSFDLGFFCFIFTNLSVFIVVIFHLLMFLQDPHLNNSSFKKNGHIPHVKVQLDYSER
jgi:hypothetical protein